MSIQSPNIAITNHLNELMLGCYNGELLAKPGLKFIEQEIFSRALGALISPASAIDLSFHLVMTPLSFLYAVGRSIYQRELDFSIPWQHLQRVRDAVFPMLFGSLFSLIHPYFGTFAAEPAKKHIATGILLSGTNKDHFDAVCSPLTTMDEIKTLASHLPNVTPREHKLLDQVHFWEKEFEQIQSIDFFNLNLTAKIQSRIYEWIDQTSLNKPLQEIAKRVSLIAFPLFVLLDTLAFAFAETVCLGTLAVKLVGGHSSAYLESTISPEVHLYNIVKIPLYLVSATFALLTSLVSPQHGLVTLRVPMDWTAKIPFTIKMLGLKFALWRLEVGGLMLVPSVETFPEEERGKEFPLLPSYGSHMRYLLIEKVDADHYQAELIERGPKHGKTQNLTRGEMQNLMETTLGLRYRFGNGEKHEVLKQFNNTNGLLDLGTQIGINNCILTNLFAALEVLHHKEGRADFMDLCREIKSKAFKRYSFYAWDFYPFGSTDAVLKEINDIFHQKI